MTPDKPLSHNDRLLLQALMHQLAQEQGQDVDDDTIWIIPGEELMPQEPEEPKEPKAPVEIHARWCLCGNCKMGDEGLMVRKLWLKKEAEARKDLERLTEETKRLIVYVDQLPPDSGSALRPFSPAGQPGGRWLGAEEDEEPQHWRKPYKIKRELLWFKVSGRCKHGIRHKCPDVSFIPQMEDEAEADPVVAFPIGKDGWGDVIYIGPDMVLVFDYEVLSSGQMVVRNLDQQSRQRAAARDKKIQLMLADLEARQRSAKGRYRAWIKWTLASMLRWMLSRVEG